MFTLLKKIEIVFENVEWIEIPAKFISALRMYDIKNFRRSYKNFDKSLAVGKFTCADIFSRIALCQDITSFELKYADGFEETIYTRWKGGDKKNNFQKNSFDDEGNLIVEIGKEV